MVVARASLKVIGSLFIRLVSGGGHASDAPRAGRGRPHAEVQLSRCRASASCRSLSVLRDRSHHCLIAAMPDSRHSPAPSGFTCVAGQCWPCTVRRATLRDLVPGEIPRASRARAQDTVRRRKRLQIPQYTAAWCSLRCGSGTTCAVVRLATSGALRRPTGRPRGAGERERPVRRRRWISASTAARHVDEHPQERTPLVRGRIVQQTASPTRSCLNLPCGRRGAHHHGARKMRAASVAALALIARAWRVLRQG